jgi:glutathione synthase/RimK-type ligase-like ATP-grasp enzyme
LLARQLGAASSFRGNLSQGKRARAGNARPYQSFLCRSVQQKKPHSFHCTA